MNRPCASTDPFASEATRHSTPHLPAAAAVVTIVFVETKAARTPNRTFL